MNRRARCAARHPWNSYAFSPRKTGEKQDDIRTSVHPLGKAASCSTRSRPFTRSEASTPSTVRPDAPTRRDDIRKLYRTGGLPCPYLISFGYRLASRSRCSHCHGKCRGPPLLAVLAEPLPAQLSEEPNVRPVSREGNAGSHRREQHVSVAKGTPLRPFRDVRKYSVHEDNTVPYRTASSQPPVDNLPGPEVAAALCSRSSLSSRRRLRGSGCRHVALQGAWSTSTSTSTSNQRQQEGAKRGMVVLRPGQSPISPSAAVRRRGVNMSHRQP